EMRYDFLFETARRWKAAAVAVGHTADDQAETVLMHLLRGAALAGLKGMQPVTREHAWDAHIPLLRPLLSFRREETEQYCLENGLSPRVDPSNADPSFFRNRIRHELIPYLESYQPNIKGLLLHMSAALAADEDYMVWQASESYRRCVVQEGAHSVQFSLPALRALPVALQRRLIRMAAFKLCPRLRDLDFSAMERGLAFLHHGRTGAAVDLVQNMTLVLEKDKIILYDQAPDALEAGWPGLPPGSLIPVAIPGETVLDNGWRLYSEISSDRPSSRAALRAADSYETWLDADALDAALYLRTRKAGDRFAPLGLDGKTTKLSDFWINSGLPRRARELWPLLISGDEIAWLPGFRPAHFCRLLENSRRILHLRLENPSRPVRPPAGAVSD
ncbi:MAG: tRNA lysidine(34) synthetase TilS, partial [Anaerolineaceae bacterium]|nr:tRNA lysidine(34) synthetase TilS [Anaerolineaceae bacterium]